MAQSFSLEEALGGASESTSTPAVGFSLEEALGVPAAPEAPTVPGPTPGLVSFINEPKPAPKKFTGSVFDTQPFEPEITPEEAVRLSRRDYAERTARLPGRVQEAKETPEEQLQRSALRAAGDTAIGVLQGAVAIPKGITDNIPFDNPLSQFYKDAYEAGEKSKSGYLRSKNVERAALLDNIRRNQGELAATRGAFTTLFSPSGADIVAQGAGSLVPAVGMSMLNLGTKSMMAMNALANAGDAAQQTAARLADMSPEDWSKSAAYQSLREQGLDHRDAVRMLAPIYALPSQVIGGITGAVSGGTGLESALVKGAARSARARAGRAGVELVGEEAETLAPMLAGNITQRIIDDRSALLEGLGQAAVETGVAAGPGAGLAAAISGKPREAAAPARVIPEEPAPAAPTEIKPATEPFTLEEALGAPAAPAAPVEAAPVSPAVQRMQEQQRAAAELEAAPEAPAEPTDPQERYKNLTGRMAKITELFRENAITNAEYEDFKRQLEEARQAAQAAPTEGLSEAKQEILRLAGQIEALGQKDFAEGMRLRARPNSPEPRSSDMQYYQQRAAELQFAKAPKEEAAAPETYGLQQFFADDQKEIDRLTQQLAGRGRIKFALQETNDAIQSLHDTIRNAGFTLNQQEVPDGIKKLKNQIGILAAGASRLSKAQEAIDKGYKRADRKRVESDLDQLRSDIDASYELTAVEPKRPTAAEEMEGVEVPFGEEIAGLAEQQRKAAEDRGILSRRTAGTSLMKVLQGTLKDGELSELAGRARKVGKNPFLNLKAPKGQPGSSMEDMVNSGVLDAFLPDAMRPGAETYDNAEAAEYIREKLRNNEFYTYETELAIERIDRDIEAIERQIQELLTIEDINKEIQRATDEQRELDQAAAEPAPEEEAGAAEERAGEEEVLKAQTEEELRAKAEREEEAAREEEKTRREEERKAAAPKAEEFVLTGSERAADQAAARGQMELAPTEETSFEKAKAKVRALADRLLEKGVERYEDTEYEGEPYQAKTRIFEGKLFGSEMRIVQDAIGKSKEITLINEPDRVMTLQLPGKNVGEGTKVRIMDSQYIPQQAKQPDMEAPLSAENEAALPDYLKAAKDGPDAGEYRFRRLVQLATERGTPINVWSTKDGLVTLAEDAEKPKYARLVVKVQPESRAKAKATEAQRKEAEDHASDVGGVVVWQEGDNAIVRGYSILTGEPVYSGTSGGSRTRVDIRRFTGNFIPADVKSKMVDAVEKIESEDKKKHQENPFITFDENGVATSANMDERLAKVAAGWKKLLGIRSNIYFTTIEDARSDKDKFTGPHRSIGSAALNANEAGSMRRMGDGYYIAFAKGISYAKMLETIAHELGHVHEREAFNGASPELKKKIQAEHEKFLKENGGKTAREFVTALRGRATGRAVRGVDNVPATELTPYWKSFSEWYADQVSRWAMTSKKPVGVVEQFFAKLGAALKRFYSALKNAKYLPSETMKQFLDDVADGAVIVDEKLKPDEDLRSSAMSIGQNIYGRTPVVAWTQPNETKLDDFIYKMQDKLIDTKRVIQGIEQSIGKIDDKWNPYLQEELFHGRTATETKQFLAGEVRPLLEQMQKEGVTIAELEEYLHNRFAPVRNENIARINPLMPDGGSGIDTADAEAYMAALDPEQKAKYEKLAARVDAITNGTRQYLVASGLEDAETIEEWEKSSPGYVPLNREDVEYSTTVGTGTGLGFSVRGPSSRRATGSKRQVVDILANTIMQRERAIVRGEKNRVATALYGLAMQNPNPDYWLAVNPDAAQSRKKVTEELVNMGLSPADAEGIMKEPAQKVVDSQTGMVTTRINPVLRSADNVLGVRINGKDRFIFFNTQNERGLRMARSLKNLDADQLGQIMTKMAASTRYFASINTQYNPVFGLYNFLRDLQGGAIQLSNTPIADKRAEVLSPKNLAGALNGIYQTLRTDRKRGQQLMTPWADLWIEFQREGGQTGYRDMFSRSQERANALQNELNRLSESKGKKAALAVPRAVFEWLADYNETLENAVRLTAYKAALDKGMSKEQAASVAKNLTVNFNRKGQVGVQAGALYAFFNSSVQGTSRLLQTVVRMDRPGDIKSLHLTKAGKTIVYGGLLLGVIQAMMMAAMGFDDEEPPDFVKDRNLIIPLPGGKYLAWPLPLGYHVIPAFSRILTEWAISGGKDSGKRIAHLAGLLMDAFSPIGNAGLSVQSIAPTIFDPIVALAENKDWTGKKIAKEDFNKLDPTPGYTRAKQNASWIGKQLSYYLNLASGGDKDKPGIVSPTPDQIDYLIGQATGGVGREVMKATKTAEAMRTGEELAPYNIPIVGRFYGDTKAGYAESSRFYKNLEEINILENQFKGRQKRQEGTADFVKENPKVRLAEAAHQVERNVQRLRKQRDQLIEKGAPKEQIKAIENRMTLQMKRLNEKAAQMEK